MSRLSEASRSPDTIDLSHRAMEDLRFIRRTMEDGKTFTAVPGWGGVGMGVTALVAAVVASGRATTEGWLAVWIADALVAAGIGLWAIHRKARRFELPVLSGAGRRVCLGVLPPVLDGEQPVVELGEDHGPPGGDGAHGGAVADGRDGAAAGGVAPPVRGRGGHGGHLLGPGRPGDGGVLHGPGGGGPPGGAGRRGRADGRGLRGAPHRVRGPRPRPERRTRSTSTSSSTGACVSGS